MSKPCPRCGCEKPAGTFGIGDDPVSFYAPPGVWKVKWAHNDYVQCFIVKDGVATWYYVGHCGNCGVYFPSDQIRRNEVHK